MKVASDDEAVCKALRSSWSERRTTVLLRWIFYNVGMLVPSTFSVMNSSCDLKQAAHQNMLMFSSIFTLMRVPAELTGDGYPSGCSCHPLLGWVGALGHANLIQICACHPLLGWVGVLGHDPFGRVGAGWVGRVGDGLRSSLTGFAGFCFPILVIFSAWVFQGFYWFFGRVFFQVLYVFVSCFNFFEHFQIWTLFKKLNIF
jgi:hypothetical protein